jgi:hypothetical protein
MFKTTAVIGLATAVVSFAAVPSYADGVFSTSNLRIGDVNLSISSNGRVLTKTDANTGQRRGQQNFREFYGMMWEPSNRVLFVAGILEGSNQPVLVKIRSTGGGGNNMFAVTPDGGSVSGYNYRLGSQSMTVRRMSYNGNLQIDNGAGTVYQIRGVGGTGNNMFALANNTSCQSVPGYNYFINCISATGRARSFPLRGSQFTELGDHRRMETSITISNNGRVDGATRIWTDKQLQGFTGAVAVVITDSAGNVLYVTAPQSYGVDCRRCPGPSDRTQQWSDAVPSNVLSRVGGYAIVHTTNPRDRWRDWLGTAREAATEVRAIYREFGN